MNFRNTIILMTSNVGSDIIKKQGTLGFAPANEDASHEKMRERILDEAKKTFRPEFLNRLDDVIVFRLFTKPDLITILSLEVEKVLARLRHKNLQLALDDKAKDFLVEKGYDPQYGARPMRRSVERFLEDPLAEEILKGKLHEGDPITVTVEGDKLVFNQNTAAAGRAVELTFPFIVRLLQSGTGLPDPYASEGSFSSSGRRPNVSFERRKIPVFIL